jgi:hypothetical protein
VIRSANARHDVAHRFEATQRRRIDLEGQLRSGRQATREARAGAGQAAQDLILEARSMTRRRRKRELNEDADGASADLGADVGSITTSSAPLAALHTPDRTPDRPRMIRTHSSAPGVEEVAICLLAEGYAWRRLT